MDLQRKTIQTLTASLDEKRGELSRFYLQFGHRLLGEATDPAAGALGRERTETWRGLMSTRENDTRAVLDIKAAVTRQLELLKFRKEIEKNLAEEDLLHTGQLEELGRAFYGQYTEEDADVFGRTYEKASAEGRLLLALEEKQDKLQYELVESGFFGKMFAQFKMARLASNIRQYKTRIMKLFSAGAAELVERGVIAERLADGSLEPHFADLLAGVQAAAGRLDELKTRRNSLEADLETVTDTLSAFAAAENPSRRMDELRSVIKETDKRIDALAILGAREYSDKFLAEDGDSILGNAVDGHTFSDMGAYSHQLEQIASFRSEISVISRKIEVLETALKIESLDKNIAGFERSIAEYERKIRHYQGLNETLAGNIREADDERRLLAEYKASVENTLRENPS